MADGSSPAPSNDWEQPLLSPGTEVEVRVDGEGFHGTWYSATVVTVAFPITRKVIPFPPHLVRPRRDYIGGGEWVPSPAVIAVRPKDAVRVYGVGEFVEVKRDQDLYGPSWFPATVEKVIDDLSYIVEYFNLKEERGGEVVKATEYLHWQFIRPSVEHSPESKLRLGPGDAVEVHCDGAWSAGVVRSIARNGEIRVSINGNRAMPLVTTTIHFLKPHQMWDGKQWRSVNAKGQNRSEKRRSIVCKVYSRKKSASKKKKCFEEPHNTSSEPASTGQEIGADLIVSQGESSSTSIRRKDHNLSLSEVSHHQLSAVVPSGYSTSTTNNSIPLVGDNLVNQDTLPNMVLPMNKRVNINTIEAFKGNNDVFDNVGWNYKLQNSSLEGTVVQEDIMLSFNSFLETIVKKSCITDSEASYEERTSILSQIKANVERAQSYQNRLNEVKSEKTKHLEEKSAVEAYKLEIGISVSQLYSSLHENHRVIAKLEKTLRHHHLKGQEIEKEIEHKESELERLDEVVKSIQEACNDDDRRHDSIVAEMQFQPFKA